MHLPTMHTDPELLLEHRAAALGWAGRGRGGCWLCHRLGAGEHSVGEGAGAGPGCPVHTPPDRLQSHWLRALPVAHAVWWPRPLFPPSLQSPGGLPPRPGPPRPICLGPLLSLVPHWRGPPKPGCYNRGGGQSGPGAESVTRTPTPHSTLMHTSRLPAELGSRVSSSPEDSASALL